MAVEVLGSRVIGPLFGVSLYVWTALISVTLVALALGYAAGGFLCDRNRSPDVLYGLILAAGALVFLIPTVKAPVLKACLPLGLRGGALAASLALFGPPLLLLGAVSPYVVRISAREIGNVGRTVGLFSAISTAGSFAGTLLTGFVLVAQLGVSRTFQISGLLLLVLSAAYFAVSRRYFPLLLVVPLGAAAFRPTSHVSKVQANGTRATEVFHKDTFYGTLKVVDYAYGQAHTRELLIDGLVQGGIDMRTRAPIYEFQYLLGFVPYALRPDGRSCLTVGLGAGVVPVWFEARGVRTDVVDIDPDVVEVARRFFAFQVSGDVFVGDARSHLAASRRQYDYVLLDAFNGDTTPAHLLSREALQLAKARVAPGGVLAMNVIGAVGHEGFMTASIVRTLAESFENVEIHPVFSVENGVGFGNLIVAAYDGPARRLQRERLASFRVHPLAAESVASALGKSFRFPPGTRSIVLTDDYNPVDFYDTWLKESLRRNILETTELDLLL